MSPIANPNGELITLHAGDYAATVTTVGAGLQHLSYQGKDLVLPFPAAELPPAYAGKTLMPWPNRVAGGSYAFGGQSYELPVNEAATGSALHGLALWSEWLVEQRSAASVTLTHLLRGEPGYPFQLALSASYVLDAATGLGVELEARNCGTAPAPYGCGSHPYVTVGGEDISNCELGFRARKVLLTDEKLRPAGLLDSQGTDFDFSAARKIASQSLDHAFTDLPEGEWDVTLRNPALQLSAVVRSATAQAPWLQLYSGELRGRKGLAVEPMTCPPDAFNSGQDLVVLEPGQSHALAFSVYGLEG
ncbi:aldose-1-epimerase [Pseudarthrobacter sp. NamB4]|uniref:aldose-1-epimerase n=1 Tax=Pseudarthrobacter sp. NamB4 TaxID=2576837 RepID=UPI0010FF2504|nr:aldose-1-epimerase [Pseudarthrobacter sp. NamB4]TLM71673.1 aldose-1-epimerase [Pseudarthrobacter sp. NamB4]